MVCRRAADCDLVVLESASWVDSRGCGTFRSLHWPAMVLRLCKWGRRDGADSGARRGLWKAFQVISEKTMACSGL